MHSPTPAYRSAADQIIADPTTIPEIDEILRTAKKEMSGTPLHMTLLYSGIALGAARVEERYQHDAMAFTDVIRACNASLDEPLLRLPEEDETRKALAEARKQFQELLDAQVETAAAEQLKEMSAVFGVEPGMISGTNEPGDIPNAQLEIIGFAAGGRNGGYLMGWAESQIAGTFDGMECRCGVCMTSQISRAVLLRDTPNSRLEQLALKLDGMGPLFRKFGFDVLIELRKQHRDLREGSTSKDHPNVPADAKTIATDMIARIKGLPSVGGTQ